DWYRNNYTDFANHKNNQKKNKKRNYQNNNDYDYYDYYSESPKHFNTRNSYQNPKEFYDSQYFEKNKDKNYTKNLSQRIFINNNYDNGYDDNYKNYDNQNNFYNSKNDYNGEIARDNFERKNYHKKQHGKHKSKNYYDNNFDNRYDDYYREPKYFDNQVEVDNYNDDYYNDDNYDKKNYQDKKNQRSNSNDNSDRKKRWFNFSGNKKKKTIFTIFISTIVICFIIVAIVLLVFFLVNRNAPSQSSSREGLSKEYMTDQSQTSKNAMDYISHRTFSMQFLYSNDQGKGKVVNGTGWIFNKEKSSDIYYIATNVHVAAALNYAGKTFIENGQENNFTNLSLKNVSLGYVDLNINEEIYDVKNLNMISLENFPEVVYLADATNSGTTFANGYSDYYLAFKGYFKPMIDFAILKFDLTSLKSSNSDFANWLKVYDTNPTEFSSNPIELEDENQFNNYIENTEFFMGGFPSLENTESTNNRGQTEWIGFSKFKTASNLNDNNDIITKSNYYTLASGAVQNSPSKGKENLEINKIDYFENSTEVNYLNIGFYWLLAAKSAGGASGSMLIKETVSGSNKFEVVGIYWGTQNIRVDGAFEGFLTEAIAGAPAVGVANMLNYTNYVSKDNTSYNGVDIFYDASEKIKNNNSVELLYNYSSKNKIAIGTNSQQESNLKKISNSFFNYSLNLQNSWR
ncbi:MAG: DUF31 family protein, partial [Malacoplasma sp.]|nr:DUF31 family protein [Malacoplasma sp.]